MATTLVPGAAAAPAPDDEFEAERHGVWKRFRRHKLALVGAVVIVLITLIAVFAKILAPADPNFIDQVNWQGTPLAPGIAHHLLGTDENGRDLLSRLMYGGQISLTVAFFAVLMELTIGTVIGAFAGYYGGWLDYALMRITDVFISIPLLPLLLVLTAIVAASSNRAALGFGVIVLIIGGLSWPPVARLVRASFLSLREKEFCEAARALGNRDGRIIFRHLLPNAPRTDYRSGDARSRQRHHPGIDLVVLRLRDSAADGFLGQYARERGNEYGDRPVGRDLSGALHPRHRARDQLLGRRSTRRARPEHEVGSPRLASRGRIR